MKEPDDLSRHAGRRAIEWPTWIALVGCHTLWIGCLAFWDIAGPLIAVPAAIAVTFHSSLQHEILHGHPTRSGLVNEALVSLPLGLAIPFRRFRDLHLRHHNDDRLTDPHDDPESFYLPPAEWGVLSPIGRGLFAVNATLLGRVIVGPALALFGFWRSEVRLIRGGERRVTWAWVRHIAGVLVVLGILMSMDIPLWQYFVYAAYPGLSLIMVRSFIEHRAAIDTDHRTAVVEACGFWRLLFLNNNYHSVHHQAPNVAWYRLGGMWRAQRDQVLQRNGGYLISGYGEVLRRWGIRQREPVVHPLTGWDQPSDPT